MPIRIWAWNKENKGLFAAAKVLRLLFVRFSMNKPPAMLVVGIKSFSFK